MLTGRYKNRKTYEEMIQEALRQIPAYFGEWTDFNSSDPGITILENLTAFQLVQQNQIYTITDEIRKSLLKLAGYEQQEGRCARVLLKRRKEEESCVLPAHQKLYVGDVCFETDRQIHLNNNRVTGIFLQTKEGLSDLSGLVRQDAPAAVGIAGERPAAGQCVYLLMDGMPLPAEELIFYAQMEEDGRRNALSEGEHNDFTRIKWQYYTGRGFEDIVCRDGTGGFLVSGELRFMMPEREAAVYEALPVKGYALRGTFLKADYDRIPRLKRLTGFLFEAWQKDTKAMCFRLPMPFETLWYELLPEYGSRRVYCRCREENCGSYREVGEEAVQEDWKLCLSETASDGEKTRQTRQEPVDEDAFRIVVWQEDMMPRYYLDTVENYDGQIIDLPEKNIVPDSLLLLAKRLDGQGEPYYDFIKPGETGTDCLSYTLSEEGKLVISEAGAFVGAKLYLASLSLYRGGSGNVRAWTEFIPAGGTIRDSFVNPCAGEQGRFPETVQELAGRMAAGLYETGPAVTAQDYERLVRETPGLCIHKVKAFADTQKNLVNIMVKPYSDGPKPLLSDSCRTAILKHLENRRLLTTQIRVEGPVYLPVDVTGVIYVRPHYEQCREQIEALLVQLLDWERNDREFGAPLRFDELYRAVEQLSCVEYIGALCVKPRNPEHYTMQGADMIPGPQCLCCPGQILLTIENFV